MGVKVSPDYAQSCIMEILKDLDIKGYVDDCGLWSDGSFEQNMELIDEIIGRLVANRIKCNPLKFDWVVQETDFLGNWMTTDCIKPNEEKYRSSITH